MCLNVVTVLPINFLCPNKLSINLIYMNYRTCCEKSVMTETSKSFLSNVVIISLLLIILFSSDLSCAAVGDKCAFPCVSEKFIKDESTIYYLSHVLLTFLF